MRETEVEVISTPFMYEVEKCVSPNLKSSCPRDDMA